MFPLLETIQIINGKPQNLFWHQQRFYKSYYLHFLKKPKFTLDKLIEIPPEYLNGVIKLRFLYDDKNCFCQYQPYQKKKINTLKLIEANNINYSLKFTNRKIFEQLLKKRESADDILIIKNQRVTDTSFSNIVFFDGKQWFTPQYPLLKGTARERLIYENKIVPKDILLKNIKDFLGFKLINSFWNLEKQPLYPIQNII